MQLFEADGPPHLVPLDPPLAYYNPASYWQQPALSYWRDQLARIPAAIRGRFEVAYPVEALVGLGIPSPAPRSLQIMLAEKRWFGDDFPYAGVYQFPGQIKIATGVIPAVSSHTLVHEYGHHIDYSYNLLWPSGSRAFTLLSSSEPFASLWSRVSADIPSGAYAATNALEWFAELWRTQIVNLPADFLTAMGGHVAEARQARAAFVALLPMPPGFLYD